MIIQLWLGSVFVPLDQDLADPDGAAAVPESLFHGLAGSHDGYTAYLTLEPDTLINASDRCGNGVLVDG